MYSVHEHISHTNKARTLQMGSKEAPWSSLPRSFQCGKVVKIKDQKCVFFFILRGMLCNSIEWGSRYNSTQEIYSSSISCILILLWILVMLTWLIKTQNWTQLDKNWRKFEIQYDFFWLQQYSSAPWLTKYFCKSTIWRSIFSIYVMLSTKFLLKFFFPT